jgi:hypothetical protein
MLLVIGFSSVYHTTRGGSMFIPGLILLILGVLASLVSFLIGLVGWIILKLMKEELHLKINLGSDKKN